MAMIKSFLPFALIIVVFYFILIRPQQKKQKELKKKRESLVKGDKIVTTGGIYGKVTRVKESIVEIEVAQNTRIQVSKSSIGNVLSGDAAGEEGK